MSFEDTLRNSLTPELFTQVVDALGDDFNYDLVPRTRLNQVIKQRNEARNALTGGKQTPKPSTKSKKVDDDAYEDDPDDGIDLETIKRQFQDASDKAIKDVKIQYAALDKLRAADVIDPELIWSSNVLDKSKLDLDAAGKLTGLDDMLTQLKQDKPHIFNKKKDDGVPGGTGKDGGTNNEGVTTKEEFLKLDVDKQIAFKKSNPALFQQFMSTM